MSSSSKYRRTYERLLVIPFGRYRRHVSEDEPDQAVFVGREGARSYLIDALTSNARRGAYLVTGRRGVGKSTFVENCVREANELKYRRYMRRSAGRTILDQVVVGLFLLSVLLLLTVDLEILLSEELANPQMLLLLMLPPVGMLIYSIFCFRTALLSLGYFSWKGTVFLSTSFVIGACFLFVDSGPLFSSSVILVSVLLLSAIGNGLGRIYGKKPHLFLSRLVVRVFTTFVVIVSLILFSEFIVSWIEKTMLPQSYPYSYTNAAILHKNHEPYLHLKSFGVVALILFYAGSQFTIARKVFSPGVLSKEMVMRYLPANWVNKFSPKDCKGKYRIALIVISQSILFVCAVLIFIVATYMLLASIEWVSSKWSIYYWLKCSEKNSVECIAKFSPSSFSSLLRDTIDNPLLCFAIVTPLFYIGYRLAVALRREFRTADSQDESLSKAGRSGTIKVARPVEILLILKSFFYVASAIQIISFLLVDIEMLPEWRSHTDKLGEEVVWLTFSILGFLIIFCIEFVWIIRAFSRLRYTEPLSASLNSIKEYTHHNDHYWAADADETTDDSIVREVEIAKFGSKVEAAISPSTSVKMFRLLNRATFPYLLIRFWTPSLVVRINLGFDSLDHRSVIHAMLHSLRNAYSKKFIQGFSPYRLIGIWVKLIVVLLMVSVLSDLLAYPDLSTPKNISIQDDESKFLDNVGVPLPCEALVVQAGASELQTGSVSDVDATESISINEHIIYALCRAMPSFMNNALRISYTRIMEFSASDGEIEFYLKKLLLHHHYDLPSYIDGRFEQDETINFRVFHAVIFIILYWIANPLLSKISPFPYRRNLRKIELLAESMISTSSVSEKDGRWSIGRLLSSATAYEKEETRGRSPLDSRSVELAFLTLLGEISSTKIIQNPNTFSLNAPAPDVIFIFDELDKIGGSPSPEDVKHALPVDNKSAERIRSEALHDLLSDMKRLISSAPCRFIFVGNRTLYDEYVADEGKREPLLTSIFDANIYLPSLLLDHSQIDSRSDKSGNRTEMGAKITEYISDTYKSANHYNTLQRGTWNSMLHLFKGSAGSADSYKSKFRGEKESLNVFEWSFPNQTSLIEKYNMSNEHARGISEIHSKICFQFTDEFAGFLAYRSKGIPKKMGDIIAGYIRPTQRLYYRDREKDDEKYAHLGSAQDMLMFDYSNIYRVQFINSLYQQLKTSFELQLMQRDDKVTIDVLYLFDFLLKFHGRAFSWSNLEHIDELAHIHKTPDLRHTIAEVLEIGVGRYFHPVLNGLYTYRFRTEFAAEVRHLSKLSEFEMAAFNFTLDESLALKTAYMQLLNSTDQVNEDLMVALGELHEYDQEYELARGWYYSALFSNDREFGRYIGEEIDVEDKPRANLLSKTQSNSTLTSTEDAVGESLERAAGIATPPDRVPYVKAILSGDVEALKNIIVHLPWATRRIRLLLQIGLTYEQTYDLERARSYYFTAHKISRTMTQLIEQRMNANDDDVDSRWFAMACDHLEVLYQPAFAAAWIAEKSVGSIDGSIEIVEFEIHELHKRLHPKLDTIGSPHEALTELNEQLKGALFKNFAMLGAEAHNKAGDLYFFKGRGSTSEFEYSYQHYARKHYSSALMMVAGYMRKTSMLYEPNLAHTTSLPSFISQLIYSNIVDISETTLAQVSMDAIMDNIRNAREIQIKTAWKKDNLCYIPNFTFLVKEMNQLASISISTLMSEAQQALSCLLNNKFGSVEYRSSSVEGMLLDRIELIDSLGFSDDYQRLVMRPSSLDEDGVCTLLRSVVLSLMASEIAEKAGLKRASISEYIMILEMIEKLLKWIRIAETKSNSGNDELEGESKYLGSTSSHTGLVTFLGNAALYALQQVERLYYRYRSVTKPHTASADKVMEPDERLQADAATHACGILLSLSHLLSINDLKFSSEAHGFEFNSYNPDSGPLKLCMDIRHAVSKCFDFDRTHNETSHGKAVTFYLDDYDFEGANYYYADRTAFRDNYKMGKRSMCEFRKFARARLIYLNDRYCFPYLGTLLRLKLLADDIYLSEYIERARYSNKKFICYLHNYSVYGKRANEANRWAGEYLIGAERFDNPNLMTNLELAETCYLKESRQEMAHSNLLEEDEGRSKLRLSDRYATFAEQSFTMGATYYKNIKRMMYLFDDFNDRKIHFKHALQMAGGDIIIKILSSNRKE